MGSREEEAEMCDQSAPKARRISSQLHTGGGRGRESGWGMRGRGLVCRRTQLGHMYRIAVGDLKGPYFTASKKPLSNVFGDNA